MGPGSRSPRQSRGSLGRDDSYGTLNAIEDAPPFVALACE
jgi:hypothetical protein